MEKTMCLYCIPRAPYLAVGKVHSRNQHSCWIEDTQGNLKQVFPIYVGPFDANKLFMFGALVSQYCQKDCNSKDILVNKSLELFDIRPATAT